MAERERPLPHSCPKSGLNIGKSVQKPAARSPITCPECGSSSIYHSGFYCPSWGKRKQRFLCRTCQHRFTVRPKTLKLDKAILGKRHVGAFPAQEAKNMNPETETETVSGDMNQQLKLKDARITQYAWKCKLRGLADNTIERRCYLLQRLTNDGADLNDPITVETVLAVKNYPTPTKWLMVNTYRTYCKAYRIDWEPVRVKYQPKKPYLPTQQDCMTFLAAMPKKLMIFCRVLFETGCRCGEAVQIEWPDINMENLNINIAHPEKGSNERTIKVSRELCQMIDTLPRNHGKNIFNPKIKTWLSTFQTYRKKIVAKFNKPEWLKLHFHSFRHIRGTLDIMNGIPLYEVKDKLGHRCISNTDKYVHWAKQLQPEGNDKYSTQTVATDDEADRLIENGWQFICVNPNTQRLHFRKAK